MESESDGEEGELYADFSSMEQPPLIKQLRQILSEYPDNGQIIKEMLQNAEDARASEVDIIYDERHINQEHDKKKPYKRFFKGPALCLKNNSLFRQEDWRGIKMIASSVKEDNKMKVGRFGLGFKSVFHMTDYTCIMSGDRILLVDPTRPSDQVNAEMKLKDLKRYKGMDVEAFFRAFGDTLGITEESISQGHYPGTVFWFPLRDEVSKISSTLYDRERVMDLFTSFENDSSEILLFLCHLESVNLHIKSDDSQITKIAGAEITKERINVRQKRKEFVESIEKATTAYPTHNPVVCSYNMSVQTTNKTGLVGETKWMVIHYFMGNNSSLELQTLAQNPDLGYNPLVGVAMPVTTSSKEPFEGHVFCFMPLPKEGSRLTGLPVHVNGFFSLSQNRHHLKWATNDQRGQVVRDNNILWNQKLIDECVPEAYKELLKCLMNESSNLGNTEQLVEIVYKAVPEEADVCEKWKRILEKLRTHLCQLPFLYSRTRQRYVTMKDALFASFTNLPSKLQYCEDPIVGILSQTQELYVSSSLETYRKLEYYNGRPLTDLTSIMLADILRNNIGTLAQFGRSQKFAILAYILSGNQYNYLYSLPLLPVASGEWASYDSRDPVYICSSEEVAEVLTEFKSKLMFKTVEWGADAWTHLKAMASQGLYQLKSLDVVSFKYLLSQSLRNKLGSSNRITNQEQINWLQKIWKLINDGLFSIADLHDVSLVPQLNSGHWNNVRDVLLYPSSYLFLKKNGIREDVCDCFTILGTTVLPDLPAWFPEQIIQKYVHSKQKHSVETLLRELWKLPGKSSNVNRFNADVSSHKRDSFLEFMRNFNGLNHASLHLLRCLNLFREGSSPSEANRYTSVNENISFIKTTSNLPVKLPSTFIIAKENFHPFLESLGATEKNELSLVAMVLNEMINGITYSSEEHEKFMLYFLDQIRFFEGSHSLSLLALAREIPFLRTESGYRRPKDLFDPDNQVLQDLFIDQSNKFPNNVRSMSDRRKSALKQLGLKEIDQINAQDLTESAKLVQSWRSDHNKYDICVRKSLAVLAVLDKNKLYQNTLLLNNLKQLKFIPCIQDKPKYFPSALPWFPEKFCKACEARLKGYENECLVGATMPIVEQIFGSLSSAFGLLANPPIEKVIEQLVLIKKNYRMEEMSNVLPFIKQIYDFLSRNLMAINSSVLNTLKTDSLVWTGNTFESPENVTIALKSSDLQDLTPYCHNIPPEFATYECLFTRVGCHPGQSVSLLIKVIHKIKSKHQNVQSSETFEKDNDLVGKIIDKLAERRNELEGIDVLLPIQTGKTNQLMFHPASSCTADKHASFFQQEEGDNSIVFVSNRVSLDAAKALGAKPLNKQILSGTESMGIEDFGQSEKLTDRLKKLIDESYTDGLSVPKELVQNADDAGATVVKFLYDERQHEDARNLLLSKEMVDCQGPSIVVYNNATFSDTDFKNITKLNGATKEMDYNKIGRFGLGFCAVYNLTDVPSFISRSNVVIFDPQKSYLTDALEGNSPGIKIDFKKIENRKLLRLHQDQFKPYEGLFDCDLSELAQNGFNGTLFRFPLRTSIRAKHSEISKVSYSREEVHELFSMFVENAGNMLLFTQHVQRLELYSISRDAQSVNDQILLFTAEKKLINRIPATINDQRTVLQRVSLALTAGKHFQETEKNKIVVEITNNGVSFFHKRNYEQKRLESSWCVSWEIGTKDSLQMSKTLKGKRALPLSAVAVQCDPQFSRPLPDSERSDVFYKTGHMFCFLPLPIVTKLPVHINGSFDVTSDRRRLLTLTDDDKNSRKNRWNEFLLSDACVNAMFTLLQHFSGSFNASYPFYRLWPSDCLPDASAFQECFFRRMIEENVQLFFGQGRCVTFSEVAFLDSKIRSHPEIGKPSFDMIENIGNKRGKILVDIPEHVTGSLSKYNNIEHAFIKETEFLEGFLENMDHGYWNGRTKERSTILAYALQSRNKDIKDKMKECKCIPVEPNGSLKMPSELVDKTGPLASMYDTEDEVFVHADLQQTDIIAELCKLGMIREKLPFEALLGRFSTIEKLAAEKCVRCALQRSKLLLRYLNDDTLRMELRENAEVIERLSNMYTLPVLVKPNGWKFSWNALNGKGLKTYCNGDLCQTHTEKEVPSHLTLARSASLFKQSLHKICGSVVNIVNEDLLKENVYIKPRVFDVLNVKSCLPTNLIVKHISILSDEYDQSGESYKQLEDIFTCGYEYLNEKLKSKNEGTIDEVQTHLNELSQKPVILVGKQLFPPHKVAFSVEQECIPHLVKLPGHYAHKFKDLFIALGVRQTFSAEVIIDVLKEKHLQWKDKECEKEEIEMIVKLLQNLEKCTEEEGKLEVNKESIIAPDIHCRLYPMHELVLADEEFETEVAMHILHKLVPRMLAETLGAKRKQLKCFEEISTGIPFGQTEKLVTRLNNLLYAYPCDSSIMKELLQNADDANASEINFIKDYRNLPTDRIFAETCDSLQGPSLCVYNDSYFTDNDLQGIHDLGEGSKRQDPTKTGQYGVGFNSIYHLTDTPSFMSKGPGIPEEGFLVIFDPTCKHLPNVKKEEPGIKCDVKNLKANFPGVLKGFAVGDSLFKNNKGTLFRFPLRTRESGISRECFSDEKLDKILHEMANDMFESLLFVKSVERINISNVSSGELAKEYSLWTEISVPDNDKRSRFFNDIKKVCRDVKDDKNKLLSVEMKVVSYKMRIMDSKGRDETYFVVQRFGFEDLSSIPETVTQTFRDNLIGCLPFGGVAHKISGHNLQKNLTAMKSQSESHQVADVKHTGASNLSAKVSRFEQSADHSRFEDVNDKFNHSKVFCFLPIPEKTNLPVHVNGHFALDDARQSLIKEGYRKEWNECLLRNVVVPAFIQCIYYLKTVMSKSIVTAKNWHFVHDLSGRYHTIFPSLQGVLNPYWEELVICLYKSVILSKHCLFPVINCSETCKNEQNVDKKTAFHCEWVSLGLKGDAANGHFNTLISKTTKEWEMTNMRTLESVLKETGLKIIISPNRVKEAIENSKIGTAACTSPDEIVAFISTSLSTDGPCKIGRIGSQLNDTNIRNVNHFRLLLRYLQRSDNFVKNIEQLPVLLTNGNKLQVFSKEHPVFCSEFAWMFPESTELFVHCDMVLLYPHEKLLKLWYMKEFSCASFIELIPDKFKQRLCDQEPIVTWNITSDMLPTVKWIAWFWKFIYEMSKKGEEHVIYKETTDQFSGWAFLPVSINKDIKLVQIRKAFIVINKYSFIVKDNLMESVCQFEPYSLDKSVFERGEYTDKEIASNITGIFRYLITSVNEPERLLEFLLFQISDRNNLTHCINEDNAACILKYFESKLGDKHVKEYPMVKEKLRKLPLFATLNKTLVSLGSGNNVFVVPPGMPSAGLDILSAQLNFVFLRENYSLRDLYKFLKLSDLTIKNLYADTVLPNMAQLPRDIWLDHIEYVKDYVLQTGYGDAEDQTREVIINCLKNIDFIKTNNGYKTCSEFFDHNNGYFKILCNNNEFPPNEYRGYKWNEFMKMLGMHSVITNELLILFACRIEGQMHDENTESKSETLVSCFTDILRSHNKESNFRTAFNRLAGIRFILPAKLSWFCGILLSHRDNGMKLICTKEAVEKKYIDECWSTIHVLPFNVDKKYHADLGVLTEPPIKDVLKHCQNISTAIKDIHLQKNEEDIKTLMNKLYTFIQSKAEKTLSKKMLQTLPIIHLPSEKRMVSVNDIVIEIVSSDVVKPYLFKAPVEYGQFFDLFRALGASNVVNCSHYQKVLNQVAMQVANEELSVPELRTIRQAITCLYKCMENVFQKDETKDNFTKEKLFLPNINKHMCESSALIIVDNIFIYERMADVKDMNYFIGLSSLKVYFSSDKKFVEMLPERLRPNLLSNVVEEKLDRENMKIVRDSSYALTISTFIRSEEFVRGLCRISKKECASTKRSFDPLKDVEKIEQRIYDIHIIEIEQLESYLMFKGEIVRESYRSKDCLIHKNDDQSSSVSFYFKMKNDDSNTDLTDVICQPCGLLEVIAKDFVHTQSEIIMLTSLMRKIYDPGSISSFLDQYSYPSIDGNINMSSIGSSIFPRPGTYVEEKFLPFLEQAMDLFDESEYKGVAMELEDEELDRDTDDGTVAKPIYIYVHIKKIVKETKELSIVMLKYLVNTGDADLIEVPGYRLYRFVRRQSPTDELTVYAGGTPQLYLPYDANCRKIRQIIQDAWPLPDKERKRIFRRLLFQWHPDKNDGSEYAGKLFVYIQQCISKLEEGGSLCDEDEVDYQSKDFSGSSYSSMFNTVNRRAQTYARAYHDNIDDYNSSTRSGNFNHRNSFRTEFKDISEARRWMQQAKHDFQAATTFLPDARDQKAYNWICYMSHQASEKALKAACYAKNANAVSLKDHSLTQPASVLSPTLTTLASQLERLVGHHTGMRYPNPMNRPQIPADKFSEDNAKTAIDITRKIIDTTSELNV